MVDKLKVQIKKTNFWVAKDCVKAIKYEPYKTDHHHDDNNNDDDDPHFDPFASDQFSSFSLAFESF